MEMRLVPLGINGFFPSFGRQTMSFLVLTPGEAVLLDAGTGVARLLEPPVAKLLRPYGALNVILSHYHLDHVAGLAYLSGTWKQGKARIYAPGPPLSDVEPGEALARLISPPLYPGTIRDFPFPVEVLPVKSDHFQIGELHVRTRRQNHPGGSMGIRINDAIAYVTDTTVEQATEHFARGAELLLHEVWLTDDEAKRDPVEHSRHSHVSGVAETARRAGVGSLMPVHHQPGRSSGAIRDLVEEMRHRTGIDTLLPDEGKVFEFSS